MSWRRLLPVFPLVLALPIMFAPWPWPIRFGTLALAFVAALLITIGRRVKSSQRIDLTSGQFGLNSRLPSASKINDAMEALSALERIRRIEQDATLQEWLFEQIRDPNLSSRQRIELIRQLPDPGPPGTAGSGAGSSGYWGSIQKAIDDNMRPGRLAYQVPAQMRQGTSTRLSVAIAPNPDADRKLRSILQETRREPIKNLNVRTAPEMSVHCLGSSGLEVKSLSCPEQPVGEGALWEFMVFAVKAGPQSIMLLVSVKVRAEGLPDMHQSHRSLMHKITVHVSPAYVTLRFVERNWQWIVGAVAGFTTFVAAVLGYM